MTAALGVKPVPVPVPVPLCPTQTAEEMNPRVSHGTDSAAAIDQFHFCAVIVLKLYCIMNNRTFVSSSI
jgi:hypothetical protein